MYPCIWIYNLQLHQYFFQLYSIYCTHKYINISRERERESEIDVTDKSGYHISPFLEQIPWTMKTMAFDLGFKSVNSRLPMSRNTVGIANLKCAVNFWPLWLLWVRIVAVPSCIGAGKILGPVLERCWSWSVVGASFDKMRSIQA